MFRHRYTLQIHIAGIFFVVVSLLSFFLIVLSYQNSKTLNEQLAAESTVQGAERLELAFKNLITPVLTALDSLAVSGFGNTPNQSNDKQWLASINAVMKRNPDVLSIYLGYPNEASAFIRSTQPSFMKTQFSTPPQSHLMVDVNAPDGNQVRTYYNSALEMLAQDTNKIDYKPTTRPWYQIAPADGSIHVTNPYLYLFIQRMGITLSRQLPDNKGIIAADITIESLTSFLQSLSHTPHTQFLLLDSDKNVIADNGFLPNTSQSQTQAEYQLALEQSPLHVIFDQQTWNEGSTENMFNHQNWVVNTVPITVVGNRVWWLAKAIPEHELIGSALEARNNQIFFSILGLFIGTGMVLWASAKIAKPLSLLGKETRKLQRMDFSSVSLPESNIVEVKSLTESIGLMSATISQFLSTLHKVSNSSNFDELLQDIVSHCQSTSEADYALLWTSKAEDRDCLNLTAKYPKYANEHDFELPALLAQKPEISEVLSHQEFYVYIPSSNEVDCGLVEQSLKQAWIFPLHNRDNERVGYVMLGFYNQPTQHQADKLLFLSQFLGFASLIKENWDRIAAQKQLFKSFIEMMASAIDTKSPYTGGHCQRVPDLTFMLAEAASKDEKRFPDFKLDNQSREALYFAAWLHDCGKVTTPEFVVDKATKLETIYNRIHEIRTRFEVLKRDAEVDYWKKRHAGENVDTLDAWLAKEHQTLDDEFAFIAKCNVGGEFMDDDNIAKLENIAKRTWIRTIDDSQGLSWEEEARRDKRGQPTLPCEEFVLSDGVEHNIPWLPQQLSAFKDWEFKLTVPELQYNRGELYNLSIQRGTLTNEERFIINDHIIQTINMLRKLPYPKHLKRVPEIAGGHHERLDGKGYPYGLDETCLPLDARIMAIADIFEALTASDRPYKKAKKLSEALTILAFMVKDKHIDEHLFRLFIEGKIYLRYAEQFLPKEQHDDVDENALFAIIAPRQEKTTAHA